MALNRVEIISLALSLMGKKPIMSLINQSDIVTAMDQAFDILLQSNLSKGNWRFAGKIVPLSKNAFTPVGGYYLYSYQLPADYLKLIHLWPQFYDWEIYQNNQIFTNFNNTSQPLYLDYISQPPISALPPYYITYFYHELASFVALSNAQRPDYAAEIERRMAIALAQAQAADAQNRPQTPLQSIPMLQNRFVTTFASG